MRHGARHRIIRWTHPTLLLAWALAAACDSDSGRQELVAPPSTQTPGPTNLAATAASATLVGLTWTDNATTESGFRIERCAGLDCTTFAETDTVAANVVHYADSGLSAATSYRYRVRAYAAGDRSTYSNIATVATRAADRLADLGMAPLRDLQTQLAGGRRLLRFTTVIVNIGDGAFEVHGQRATMADTTMSIRHRIFDEAGSWRDVPMSSVMEYSGDGHDHWHVRDLQVSELLTPGGASLVRGNKHGFCFWDNAEHQLDLPRAPQSPVYQRAGCGHDHTLTVAMGLSVGWGDTYSYSLADQYIDVTGVADGAYRLVVTADPAGWFRETDETNNFTWVDLELRNGGQEVLVLAYGPSSVMAGVSSGADIAKAKYHSEDATYLAEMPHDDQATDRREPYRRTRHGDLQGLSGAADLRLAEPRGLARQVRPRNRVPDRQDRDDRQHGDLHR